MALDPVGGRPSLAYARTTALYYAQAEDPAGAAWPPVHRIARGDSLFDTPYAVSLGFDDAGPALAYFDAGDLRFVRSAEAHGAPETWTDAADVVPLNSFYEADVSLIPLGGGLFGVGYHQSNTNALDYAVYH